MSKKSLSLINALLDDETYKAYRGPSKGFNPRLHETSTKNIKSGRVKLEIQKGLFKTLKYCLSEDLDTHEYILKYSVDGRSKTQRSKVICNFLSLIDQRDGLATLMIDCLIK